MPYKQCQNEGVKQGEDPEGISIAAGTVEKERHKASQSLTLQMQNILRGSLISLHSNYVSYCVHAL